MIDLSLLRKNPEHVIALILKKDPSFDGNTLVELDKKVRTIRLAAEELRHKKNELASLAKGGVTDELRSQSIEVGKKLKQQEHALEKVESEFKALALRCPNLPYEDVPQGGVENNVTIKSVGEKTIFSFTPRNHVELGTALKWFDFESAATMTGSNFALYKGDGVRIMYALSMYMLKHNIQQGYEPVLPPYLVNESSLINSSNFPKFRDQVYAVTEDELFLTPTSEVNITNIYRNTMLDNDALPVRVTSWTSCFRREAGGYGATERGLIRIHQFEKIELYTVCKPENSDDEQQRMLACVESLLQSLGLTYRIVLLATQDCSFQSARTFDVEVWLPGQGEFYEVSSISSCTDFQSRRAKIRYKKTPDSKPELVHTLNGSSLALPRLIVAIMETFQQEDGTVRIPEVLKHWWL